MVALEGGCYTGKTTLAHALAAVLGAAVVPEYADLAPLPPFPPADLEAVHEAIGQLLAVERRRAHLAEQAVSAGHRLVLADRSAVSCIAFQHAVGVLDVPCDPRSTASRFASAARDGTALLPAAYLYLHADNATIATRQRDRGPVMSCLTDPRVIGQLDLAYAKLLASLPSDRHLTLDSSQPLPELVALASAFIASVPPVRKPEHATAVWTDPVISLKPTPASP